MLFSQYLFYKHIVFFKKIVEDYREKQLDRQLMT